jgi:hypothetical protein
LYDLITRAILALWRGIDPEYKSQYARTIWTQFEEQIKYAANTTSSLPSCLSSITARFAGIMGGNLEDLEAVEALVKTADAREVLRVLREESAYIIAMVRLENERLWEERKNA